MKKLKLSLSATVLTLALSLSAFAGDMQCGVTSQAPAQPTSMTAGETQTTVVSTSGTSVEAATLNPVTETALSLMQSLLSLF
jgi:hypothetical protein